MSLELANCFFPTRRMGTKNPLAGGLTHGMLGRVGSPEDLPTAATARRRPSFWNAQKADW